MQNKRLLIKISWEALSSSGGLFDVDRISFFVDEFISLSENWFEVAVVIWAWNIWRYRDNKDLDLDRVKSDTLWMTATVFNSCILSEKIKSAWHDSVVYSPDTVTVKNIAKRYVPEKVKSDLTAWKIVFCAGWTGSPFFTTDTAATLRASELGCDLILKATKVDWVYDKDPTKNVDAVKYDSLTYDEALENKLWIMDMTAFSMAQENEIDVIVFNMNWIWNMLKAAEEDLSVWTIIKS